MQLYQIALTMVPGVGDVLGKKILNYCGNAEAVFKEKKHLLMKIPRVGGTLVKSLNEKNIFERAEKEIAFIRKFQIKTLFYTDNEYPSRLKNCLDSPLMLYYKGNASLNTQKVLGIVGTRNATLYGKEMCHQLIKGITDYHPLIISGLAYGIDSAAHRNALENGLETVGVLGHGLDRIYPDHNKSMAEKMIRQGGLITDYMSETNPDRENFPMRNRIIAGLCDAIIVVEAAQKGGALITADIANSYNRDVFAFPGRVGDTYSEGTNMLIRQNKAALIQSAEDILYLLGWDVKEKPKVNPQRKIFIELTPDEEKLLNYLNENGETGIDELCLKTGIRMSKVSAALLNLEFEGVVQSLPGKVYLPG